MMMTSVAGSIGGHRRRGTCSCIWAGRAVTSRLWMTVTTSVTLWSYIIASSGLVSRAANTIPEECIAYESSYHVDKGCQCIVVESNGGSEGIFKSTNYPKPCPASISCVLYTFVGDLGEIVELSFSRFDLHAPRSNAATCSDYVRLYLDLERPELDAGRRPTLELCGNLSLVYRPA